MSTGGRYSRIPRLSDNHLVGGREKMKKKMFGIRTEISETRKFKKEIKRFLKIKNLKQTCTALNWNLIALFQLFSFTRSQR